MVAKSRVLEDIRIASPCTASWSEMVGDEHVRFCGHCEKNVYNLSAMTRADAERLVVEAEGRKCLRFFRRADGTVLTSDCPEGVREKRATLVKLGVRAGGLGALLAGAVTIPLFLELRPRPTPLARLAAVTERHVPAIPSEPPVVMGIPPTPVVPVEVQGGMRPYEVKGGPIAVNPDVKPRRAAQALPEPEPKLAVEDD